MASLVLTAEQFKDRLKNDHIVTNVIVNEPVLIDFRDTGSFTGDFTIQNCALKTLHISDNAFTSLTLKKGSVQQLSLQTSADIQHVVLNKCDIQKLTITEALIGQFEFTAGQVKTAIDGQLASLASMTLSGVVKSVLLISPSCSEIQLVNFQATDISLISLQPGNLTCKNLTANKILINYGMNKPDNVLFQNLSVKDLQVTSEGVRTMAMKGDLKFFSACTIPIP